MKKNNTSHKTELLLVSGILLGLLLLVLNPGMFWMPSMLEMSIGLTILVLFIVFCAYIWKEQARDEREQAHILYAGRFAFFVGSGILVAGTLFEYFIHHNVNKWIVFALASMILTKTLGRLWAEKYR